MKTTAILILAILALQKYGCRDDGKSPEGGTTDSGAPRPDTAAAVHPPPRLVKESRRDTVDGKVLEWKRYTDTTLEWNGAALAAAAVWKADTVIGRHSDARNALAEAFDADSSLLLGLTLAELNGFLGPTESRDLFDARYGKVLYRYDQDFNDKGDYLGCWLVAYSDTSGRVSDVARICP